jgi:hypothetical protein
MTEKKFSYALKGIKTCKDNGSVIEALIKSYHLNVEVIKYILDRSDSTVSVKDKKVKTIVHEFLEQISVDPKLKAIINKKTFKSVKPWLKNMDVFFKALKLGVPSNIKSLQIETEKIFNILNISMNKLYVKSRA